MAALVARWIWTAFLARLCSRWWSVETVSNCNPEEEQPGGPGSETREASELFAFRLLLAIYFSKPSIVERIGFQNPMVPTASTRQGSLNSPCGKAVSAVPPGASILVSAHEAWQGDEHCKRSSKPPYTAPDVLSGMRILCSLL